MDHAHAVRAVPHTSPRVEVLLRCGAIAGPLFIVVAFAQAVMRSGFDFTDHPLSLLTLGGLGWVQIVKFRACRRAFHSVRLRDAAGSG